MEIFPRGFILGRNYGNFTKTFKVIAKDEFGNQCQAILKLKHGMLKLVNNSFIEFTNELLSEVLKLLVSPILVAFVFATSFNWLMSSSITLLILGISEFVLIFDLLSNVTVFIAILDKMSYYIIEILF